MSFIDRLFGRKSIQFVTEANEISQVVQGYPTGWPIWDSYGLMYRRQPAVRTVVDFLARNIAQLNPKIYMRVDDTDRREWNDHPVAELLRSPNPTTTRYAFLRDTVADIKIYDRGYWRKVRTRGLITGLVRIPPSRLSIEVDQQTLKTTYRFNGEPISREELVIFYGYHPDGGEEGVSPLETLRRVLAEDWASSTHREWYWRNASRQGGVIERPLDAPDWTPEAQKMFMQQWNDMTTGGVNSGVTPMLIDGMKWNGAGFSPRDSEYIASRKLTTVEVARVYAPSLVGLIGEGAAGEMAVESFHRQLYQDVLAPDCRMLQDEIDAQLLGLEEFDFGDAYTEFNLAEKLKGSFEEQGRTLVTAVGVPYMTINEGRTRLNLPRIADEAFDVPIQPLNVLYGGQPSVVVPTADPSTASVDLTDFFSRQERSVVRKLTQFGNLELAWGNGRWDRELAPLVGDEKAAGINAETRLQVAEAFENGGVPAVEEVFTRLRHPTALPA